ncbi:ABC transporter permease [Streptomyces sp. 549]|uniref:ABC transporter permease n=1 Tax=Streptomyces sp. 549 TaxID=3049076 RepID=UPI0024C31897|nr:ABC transporter permease [Streptomyces sp. 549]MDK1474485.1 ABC transporter permease [Streptomyces sp. 549]
MILRLAGRSLLTAVAATAVVFAATELLPGDAGGLADSGRASEADLAQRRADLGLDRPAAERYLDWLGGTLRWELGRSLVSGRPVTALLAERLPASVVLVAVALALTAALTLLALAVAYLRGGRGGGWATGLAAVPQPVYAAGLTAVLAGLLGWLPAVSVLPPGGSPLDAPQALVLPALTLALPSAAFATVLLRGTLEDTVRRAHVGDARIRGLPALLVLRRHVLPFLAVPALQLAALLAGGLMAGTALVETLFGYPGTGHLLVSAVAVRDIPVVQAAALPPIAVLLLGMLLADLLARRSADRPAPADVAVPAATCSAAGDRCP